MFPVLIAGLILRLTDGWFVGQHTVGDVCLWVGGVTTLVPLLIFAAVTAGVLSRS
jgi:hypothetical protein